MGRDTDRAINREIFRLAIPSIIANITIPVVGMVAIAVVGHLKGGEYPSATLIGGISLGSMLFDLVYWNFGFLRTATGGLTAQAFGRGDLNLCADTFCRAQGMAFLSAALLLVTQYIVVKLALLAISATPEVEYLASRYFYVRIWAAPATLSLMAVKGWMIGMQDALSPMITDIVVNVVNVIASVILTMGIHVGKVEYAGNGFIGVAQATVLAQYSGYLTALVLLATKYSGVFSGYGPARALRTFKGRYMRQMLRTNLDLFIRSVCFIGIYIGFTAIAASYGDMVLAVSSIMMQLMMLFSYITDGFAYAGEAMVGKYLGEGNSTGIRRTILYVFVWSFVVTLSFMAAYVLDGEGMLSLLSDDRDVLQTAGGFLVWLRLMPLVGCAAFTWDGVFTGASQTGSMRNSMLLSLLFYFVVYFVVNYFFNSRMDGKLGLHILLAAYCLHLLVRTVYLSVAYIGWPGRGIMSRDGKE